VLIELDNVSRRFSHVWALRDVSARFESGKIYAVLGANGAGKSTLLSLLAGWMPATSGKILIDGSPLRPTSPRLRRQILLLDEVKTKSSKTMERPLRELTRTISDYQADRPGLESSVSDWCERLEIVSVATKPAASFSKGQAYKLAMVGLFVIGPPVWLLDEPFSAGLDAAGLFTLEEQVRAQAERGGIVIFSSQWPEHAKRLADQAIVLHEGRIAWAAPPNSEPDDSLLRESPESLLAVLRGLG
jgi:ABC-type multidrug transport system ATPase subunit